MSNRLEELEIMTPAQHWDSFVGNNTVLEFLDGESDLEDAVEKYVSTINECFRVYPAYSSEELEEIRISLLSCIHREIEVAGQGESLAWLREYPGWSDAGQTDDDPTLTDDTHIQVYEDGSVDIVGGGSIVSTNDVDMDWIRFLLMPRQ